MKYEPIFGDQSLFDGAPEDADAVFKSPMRDSRCAYYRLSHGHERYIYTDWVGVPAVDSQTFNAMRRIIPEPKRWTVEDQRAGRLPDVGSIGLTNYGRAEYLGNDSTSIDKCHVRYEDGYCERIAIEKFTPLETPEEKAARLCNEWCKTAADIFVRHPSRSGTESMEGIYKAMLSGDLPVPGKEQL